MKTTFKLFLSALLLVTVFSCNLENIEEESVNSEIQERKTLSEDIDAITDGKEESLHNKMQWASYITAQTLLNSSDARDQMRDALIASGSINTLNLSDLLSENLANQSFRDEFRAQFEFYLNIHVNDPCSGVGRPEGTPRPTGTLGGMPETLLFDIYVSSLIYEDCLEYYMPNGYVLIPITSPGPDSLIKSTAHPLDTSPTNVGYSHTSRCYVAEIDVDDFTTDIIIVVRPYRDDFGCTYEEYDVDFEEFLD